MCTNAPSPVPCFVCMHQESFGIVLANPHIANFHHLLYPLPSCSDVRPRHTPKHSEFVAVYHVALFLVVRVKGFEVSVERTRLRPVRNDIKGLIVKSASCSSYSFQCAILWRDLCGPHEPGESILQLIVLVRSLCPRSEQPCFSILGQDDVAQASLPESSIRIENFELEHRCADLDNESWCVIRFQQLETEH
jgi:hypothetical protein